LAEVSRGVCDRAEILMWVFLTPGPVLALAGFISDYHAPGICWEKAMAPHSSTLAWKIPWMEEPGRLQSMGSQRVGHD